MRQSKPLDRDLLLLLALAAAKLLFHLFTNGHYGFHRDELATLDDAHHLAWATSRIRRSPRSSDESSWRCSVRR